MAAAAATSMGATAVPGRHELAEVVDGEERLRSTSSSNPFFPTSHGFRRNQIGHGKEGRDLGRSNDEGKKKNLARELKKIKEFIAGL